MSRDVDPIEVVLRHELAALRGKWWWFATLGGALVVLGVAAMGSAVVASVATAVIIGALILASGVGEILGSFWCREWSGFFLELLSGVLAVVVGFMFLGAPGDALVALTMLVGSFLLVGGIFKLVAALTYRFHGWIWPLIGGVVDVLLGLLIWRDLPASAFWVLGLCVGINLVFRGMNWLALGLALRAVPPPRATRA